MYVYLNTLLARIRGVPGVLDGLGVVDCVLAAKRMVFCFRDTREEHMLSSHSAEPAYIEKRIPE